MDKKQRKPNAQRQQEKSLERVDNSNISLVKAFNMYI